MSGRNTRAPPRRQREETREEAAGVFVRHDRSDRRRNRTSPNVSDETEKILLTVRDDGDDGYPKREQQTGRCCRIRIVTAAAAATMTTTHGAGNGEIRVESRTAKTLENEPGRRTWRVLRVPVGPTKYTYSAVFFLLSVLAGRAYTQTKQRVAAASTRGARYDDGFGGALI